MNLRNDGVRPKIKKGREGYANYLKEKFEKISKCTIEAQFTARNNYLKKISPEIN
jgi:hypothetical protein